MKCNRCKGLSNQAFELRLKTGRYDTVIRVCEKCMKEHRFFSVKSIRYIDLDRKGEDNNGFK